MSDATAILWKEWREVMGQRGLRGKTGILLNLGVFGIVIPLQFGESWVTSPLTLLTWAWVPMFLVMMVISDAFAGERERHTLETLLATRLSDRAILFGKIGAALAYGAAITAASLVLGLITVNLASGPEGVVVYPWPIASGMIGFGLPAAVFVAALGVLISLRAATVRQAEQTLGGVIIVVMIIPFVAVRLFPPAWRVWFTAPENASLLGVGVVALLAALDTALLWLALKRFQRSRLITDGAL